MEKPLTQKNSKCDMDLEVGDAKERSPYNKPLNFTELLYQDITSPNSDKLLLSVQNIKRTVNDHKSM